MILKETRLFFYLLRNKNILFHFQTGKRAELFSKCYHTEFLAAEPWGGGNHQQARRFAENPKLSTQHRCLGPSGKFARIRLLSATSWSANLIICSTTWTCVVPYIFLNANKERSCVTFIVASRFGRVENDNNNNHNDNFSNNNDNSNNA